MKMGEIKKLNPKIYRKIAAGEVVERPSSVVKELIENSIDALADKIIVEVEKGGLEKIKVTDNGSGISKEEIPLAFEHYTTSKIETEEDLFNIRTMGFRGEALSSISAVSEVHLISKTKTSSNGYFYAVSGGEFLDKGVKAFQNGTSTEVKNIFFNVPARKKFLKTDFTEFSHITRVFIDVCLANIKINFKLIHNGKEVYNVEAVSDFKDRIKQLFGKDVESDLIPVFCDHPHIKISGFVAKPQAAYATKTKQFVMVNGRSIRDRIINSAVREGFGSLVMHSHTPLYFISVSVPTDFVDVNTHPRKEEVRFINSNLIYSLVKRSVSEVLMKKDLSFKPDSNFYKYHESKPLQVSDFKKPPSVYSSLQFYSQLGLQENGENKEILESRDVIIFNNLYLITIAKECLEIYDQHALHERILYEKFKKALIDKNPMSQALLIPQTLEFSEDDFQILMLNKKIFKDAGFEVELFGKRTLKISAIPLFLDGRTFPIKNMFMEFSEDFKGEKIFNNIGSLEEKALSIMSCRSAVKAGTSLTKEEALEFIRQGKDLTGIYTCPHGRPFKIKIKIEDLEKMFKRI